MSFFELQFPPDISYGATGGPGFNTTVVSFASGYESRNANRATGLMVADVSHTVKTQAQLDALITFFRVAQGKTHGFRFKDWTDFTTTQVNGVLGAGLGTGLPAYQLNKIYAGGTTIARVLKKPVAGSVVPLRGGGAVTFGVAAGNVSLDSTTGILTFVPDATSNASAITAGATTQVVLAANPGTLTAGQLLYLTAFTGADAALVNGLAHSINTVTGSGPFTFTLATNTSGKTITLGAGQGRKYPQVSETLTHASQFDVPCRFDTDQLRASITTYGNYAWGNVPIVEIAQ